jgi:hypothetical protein
MGIFESVMQERYPLSESVTLTPHLHRQRAWRTGRNVARERDFQLDLLFRQPSPEPVQAVVDHVTDLISRHGAFPIVALASKALTAELRAPAFAIAVDLVLANGQASLDERKFIDGLQGLLQIPDEEAMKIVDVIIVKNIV